MGLLITLIIAGLGCLAGLSLKIAIIQAIAPLSFFLIIFLIYYMDEGMEGFKSMIYVIWIIVFNVAMLICYYFSTNQTFIGEFLRQNILR